MIRFVSIVFCFYALIPVNDPFVELALYMAILSNFLSLWKDK